MIRLSFPILDNPIEIAENVVNVLILESPRCFRELVCDIKEISNKLEGKTKLSKDFEIIPYDKFVHTVFSAEAIDINCKKILNKIIGNLREIAYSEIMCEKTMKINCEFLGYISDLTENTTLDLIYDELASRSEERRIIYIMLDEYRLVFRDSGLVVVFLGATALYPLLYSSIYRNETVREVPIAVVDQSNTSRSRDLVQRID